tara:strand:- start:3382 stop:5619 length:2238 start_codon:yes stop_codon:yes gene_type:complete
MKNFLCSLYFLGILFTTSLNAEILKKVEIQGNSRISSETIKVYGEIELNKDYSNDDINGIIKKLYNTKFFSKISTNFSNNTLRILVEENPIINTIIIDGEKAKKFKKVILDIISLKEKSAYVESDIRNDIEMVRSFYKSLGYYAVEVEAKSQPIGTDDKRLNLIFSIKKGEKYKISKINFIGDKKVKNKRLRDVIASEEHRFWKIISRNVYLNNERIELDKRLLKSYYLGKGYYNVEVVSSSAESKSKTEIELTYSINAGERFRIKKLSTDIDPVFDKSIFQNLAEEFNKFAGDYYSPFKVQKILKKIDDIVDDNELQFVQHSVSETIDDDGVDIVFKIIEGPKVQIERVNIFGNTVTSDSVIRSELLLDEGDPYSKVKLNKSISKLKSRNIFKKVQEKVIDGSAKDLKVMEITVEEKPTGEIMAGAGVGTDGTAISFAIKENNYLGKGLGVDATINLSEDSVRGGISISDPNFKYSGNLVYGGLTSTQTDNTDSGYENTVTNFNLGTRFEQYEDVYFTPGLDLSFDDLKVDSSASSNLKKQAGDFTELIFSYGIDRDKRDRSFMPSSGSIISFRQGVPIFADQAALFNRLSYSQYHGFNDNVIGAVKFYGATITALDEDVRLSKRLRMPAKRLRGFSSKQIGPVDQGDYVGGNYVAALNFEAQLPNLLPESTNTDVAAFLDFGNLWSVDYDSSAGSSSKVRSSVGLTTQMWTPIGPVNFVLAQALSKADSDQTQSFKFQIGTSF